MAIRPRRAVGSGAYGSYAEAHRPPQLGGQKENAMTIAGWACPNCHQRVPLNHYATTKCGLAIHPAYAAAVLYDDANDPHGKEMSVTDGLGCPRLRAIENQAEDLYVNPLDYNAMLLGSAWDAVVGMPDDFGDGDIAEPEDPLLYRAKIQLRGTIAGMKVTGELDNVRRLDDMLILSDWKHSNNFRAKWIKQEGGPSIEYKIQTSIYAELYRQMYDETPTHGEVVYHFSGSGKDVLVPYQYPIMPIEECLAYRPYSGTEYTVEQLYRMAQPIYTEVPDGRPGVRWQELPLVGVTMSFGSKSFCDYCQAKDLCFTAERGAPF